MPEVESGLHSTFHHYLEVHYKLSFPFILKSSESFPIIYLFIFEVKIVATYAIGTTTFSMRAFDLNPITVNSLKLVTHKNRTMLQNGSHSKQARS